MPSPNPNIMGRPQTEITKERISEKMKSVTKGSGNSQWKGGRVMNRGYVLIYKPDHPNRSCGNYVYEHRLVVEQCMGRLLEVKEAVHHLNRDRADNRPENLIGFVDMKAHKRFERSKLSNLENEIAEGRIFFDGRIYAKEKIVN